MPNSTVTHAQPALLSGRTVAEGAVGPGLVISAITAPNDFLSELVGERFAFPSADLLGAAAGQFPAVPGHTITSRWHAVGIEREDDYFREPVKDENGHPVVSGWGAYRDTHEGARATLELAPGLVRYTRADPKKRENAAERAAQARLDAQLRLEANLHRPMALVTFDDEGGTSTRGVVSAWSAKSRARMISTICELDLAPLVSGDMLPGMITLTLPGDWLAVAPDAATAAQRFHVWARAFEKKWGPLRCIWKREFQKRGAPHWHLWMVPPVSMRQMREFKVWLSESWTKALFGADAVARVADHERPCKCGEVCRSWSAGTGVDFAEGLRARDPKRLAIYFLKESLGGEGKAYQNGAPAEWAGQSVGRFWGYRGLDKAVVGVPLAPGDDIRVLRVLRRWQSAQGITRQVEVWGTRERDRRKRAALRRSGEVTVRRLRRPARVVGTAGWVAVNDGALIGSELGRWASAASGAVEPRWHHRPLRPGDTLPLDPAPVAGGLSESRRNRLAALRAAHPRAVAVSASTGSIPADPPWLCTLPADHPAILAAL